MRKSGLLVIFLLSFFTLRAQPADFERTVHLIRQKVACCSVPFSPSSTRKVDQFSVNREGDITLSYSDNKKPQTFNLFKLYKEEAGSTGIDTVMGGRFIQFYVSASKISMIRFASAADAGDAYNAMLKLFALCKREVPNHPDLNFDQTLKNINKDLAAWAAGGESVKVSGKENGELVITNRRQQSFRFNLFDLEKKGIQNDKNQWIEAKSCDPKAHAPRAWLNFNKAKQNVAFIRLDCNIPLHELENIRKGFLRLKSLCTEIIEDTR